MNDKYEFKKVFSMDKEVIRKFSIIADVAVDFEQENATVKTGDFVIGYVCMPNIPLQSFTANSILNNLCSEITIEQIEKDYNDLKNNKKDFTSRGRYEFNSVDCSLKELIERMIKGETFFEDELEIKFDESVGFVKQQYHDSNEYYVSHSPKSVKNVTKRVKIDWKLILEDYLESSKHIDTEYKLGNFTDGSLTESCESDFLEMCKIISDFEKL